MISQFDEIYQDRYDLTSDFTEARNGITLNASNEYEIVFT